MQYLTAAVLICADATLMDNAEFIDFVDFVRSNCVSA
jgi:hypothetical protein